MNSSSTITRVANFVGDYSASSGSLVSRWNRAPSEEKLLVRVLVQRVNSARSLTFSAEQVASQLMEEMPDITHRESHRPHSSTPIHTRIHSLIKIHAFNTEKSAFGSTFLKFRSFRCSWNSAHFSRENIWAGRIFCVICPKISHSEIFIANSAWYALNP